MPPLKLRPRVKLRLPLKVRLAPGLRLRLRGPWSPRALFGRAPTREQALLEALARAGEPQVASWARAHRELVRDSEDLLRALERLHAQDDPAARTLAAAIWLAWRHGA